MATGRIGRSMVVGACMPQRRRTALSCFTRTIRTSVLYCQAPSRPRTRRSTVATTPYAELHAHTNFSFLDGASAPDDLVAQAVARGLTALAATDRNGLYGSVRFMGAAEEAGLRGVVGTEIELLDPAVSDPDAVVIAPRRRRRRRAEATAERPLPVEGRPVRPRPTRARLPGQRDPVKEDYRGIGERARGPHLVLLARTPA